MPLKKRPDGKFDTGRPLLYTDPKKMQEKIDVCCFKIYRLTKLKFNS